MRKNKMFCFTYAGGSASFYNQLEDYVKDEIEVIKMEYAGHGIRHKESFYGNFTELAEDMYSIMKAHCDQSTEYALMGYSMGTIAVVEILKQLIRIKEIPLPKHIFLAAHEPEARNELKHFSTTEEDEIIKKRTIQFGGIPESLVSSKSFWRVYLPIYKADYRLIRDYDFDKLDIRSEIPTTVFYSEEDTPLYKMKKWQNFFVGECGFKKYEGNHFFINNYCNDIANIIKKNLVNKKESFKMKNLEKYINVFVESFEISEQEVEGLQYQGISTWDSVGHMNLITVLEDTFDIMMDTDDIIDFSSFEKGKELLKKYGVEI